MKLVVLLFRMLTRTVKSLRVYLILFRLLLSVRLKGSLSVTKLNYKTMTKEKFNKIINVVCALISAIGAAIATLLN